MKPPRACSRCRTKCCPRKASRCKARDGRRIDHKAKVKRQKAKEENGTKHWTDVYTAKRPDEHRTHSGLLPFAFLLLPFLDCFPLARLGGAFDAVHHALVAHAVCEVRRRDFLFGNGLEQIQNRMREGVL